MCESEDTGYENHVAIMRDIERVRTMDGHYVHLNVAVHVEEAAKKSETLGISPLEFMAIGGISGGLEGTRAVKHNGREYQVTVGPQIELRGIPYRAILDISPS